MLKHKRYRSICEILCEINYEAGVAQLEMSNIHVLSPVRVNILVLCI